MALLPIVLLSSLIGAIVGGTLIALKRHDSDMPMPFGPFIAMAGWVWFVAGDRLLHAYLQLTGLR
jgi:leader peptidase (prepilin peptidase)/N-methyltransferase